MRFIFSEQKAAEAAAHLLRLAGGRMPYIKLLKLLYLADREALIATGFPITGDRMVSMDRGPVLSRIYDYIGHGRIGEGPNAWYEFVSPPEGWDVKLAKDPPAEGELSDYEIGVLRTVFDEYGHVDRWALIEMVHELPEWDDPQGSSLPINPETVLRAAGKTDQQIAALNEEAEHFWFVERRIGVGR
jgi:uncharacterized phage-associated protein